VQTKILLTGASGFIGKHCLDYLRSSNNHIYCLSRSERVSNETNVTWLPCDILDETRVASLVQDIRPDYLIHCAWYVEHQKFWHSPLNQDYVFATAELWKHFISCNGKKAVFLGSCAEILEQQSASQSTTIYGRSKLITSNLISLISECTGHSSSFVWGRIFGLYGPGEHPLRIVPYLLNSYLAKETPEVKTPFLTYDFIYVKNLAKMIVDSLFSEVYGIIDFGQESNFSIHALANYLHLHFFPHARAPHALKNEDKRQFIPDLRWQKSIKETMALISFDDSIAEYIAYLKEKTSICPHELGTQHG